MFLIVAGLPLATFGNMHKYIVSGYRRYRDFLARIRSFLISQCEMEGMMDESEIMI